MAHRTPELRLTAAQDRFVRAEAPMLLYRGGVASGKTVAGCVRTIVRRYRYPGTVQLVAGPSWDQVRDGTMRTLRGLLNPRCIVRENQNEHLWVLDNGSEIMFRTTADPDVLRAVEFHDAYLDEAALMAPGVLDVVLGRVRLPYREGGRQSVWCTTTPRGMDWTLDVWGREGRAGYEVVRSTIYDARGNLPDGYIERLENKYRDTPFYEQELLGEYTAFEGLVYPMFGRDRHLRAASVPVARCAYVCIGVDYGGTADPSAAVLVGEAGGRLHVYAEWRRVGATISDLLAVLDGWTRDSGRTRQQVMVRPDPSGTVLNSSLAAYGWRCEPAQRDKLAGILLVAERLTGTGGVPALTVDPGCVYLAGEFGQYVWRRRRMETGVMVQTHGAVDHHADLLDALRYSVTGLGQVQPVRVLTTATGRRLVVRA